MKKMNNSCFTFYTENVNKKSVLLLRLYEVQGRIKVFPGKTVCAAFAKARKNGAPQGAPWVKQ